MKFEVTEQEFAIIRAGLGQLTINQALPVLVKLQQQAQAEQSAAMKEAVKAAGIDPNAPPPETTKVRKRPGRKPRTVPTNGAAAPEAETTQAS